MKIGFFTDEYLPRTDGVVTSMINFKQGLEDLGHEVFIIAPKYPGYHDEPNGIIRVSSLRPILFDNIRIMNWGRRTRQLIVDLDLDVIHSQTNFWASVLAAQVAKKTGAPHVATIHTIWPRIIDHYPMESRISQPIMPLVFRYLLKTSPRKNYKIPELTSRHPRKEKMAWQLMARYADIFDIVILPSEHLANLLKDMGVQAKLAHLPNSIDLDKYSVSATKTSKEFRIVCAGRLSTEKRQRELIAALKILKEGGTEAHLTLVGSGPARSAYERQVDRLGLNKEVSFTGQLEPHDVKQLLAQADVGTLVSLGFDNQPMVILEYAASGLPIVYCDPALTEGLTGANSLLSKPDAKSLAATLEKLAADAPKRQKMSKASLEVAQDFDVKNQSTKLLEIYRQLIS